MANLVHLSTELLDSIVVLLQQQDLARLARSCKKLHFHATPTLYRCISWTWSGGSPGPCVPPPNPPIRLLLRSILVNPDLARLIEEVDLQAVNFRVRHQNPKRPADGPAPDRTTLAMVSEKMSWASNKGTWLEAVRIGNVGASIAFLLTQLPELRSLSLGPDLQQSNMFLAPALLHMATKSGGNAKWKRLCHVNLGTAIRGNDHRHWSIDLPFAQFMPFFYSSSLNSAEMMFPGSSDRLNRATVSPPGDESSTALPWPLPAPFTPSLTSLCLKRSRAEPRILQSLTAIAPRLRRLEYDYWLQYYLSLDTKGLRQALDPVKDTLEHLVIGFTPFSSDAADPGEVGSRIISGALGSLRHFQRLRSLEISLTVLLGWYVEQAKDLSDVLPASLQIVTFRDDCSGFDEWEWWDDACMDAFTSFLTGNWRSATPLLTSFNVRMIEEWEDPRSLPDLCRAQGIDCEVYIGRTT